MLFIDKLLLAPYYLTIKIRNRLYDTGTWKSFTPQIPSICVGNVTVGGTGKTPHTEMLVRFLKDDYRIAIVSRGYKRKTSGFREVLLTDNYQNVGDEPLQVKKKFPNVTVVVDASRRRAIEKLQELPDDKKPSLIILDDAFQHRQVKPTLSILLVDYSRPIFEDHLLPIGELRDLPTEIRRAEMVIVTKFPDDTISPSERERWRKNLRLRSDQPLFFSRISYHTPLPVFPDKCNGRYLYSKSAILFSGIANDSALRSNMSGTYKLNIVLRFTDHHDYSHDDIRTLENASRQYPTSVLITTEKDAQRIVTCQSISDGLRSRLFYVPICSDIIPELESTQRVILEEMPEIGKQQFKKALYLRNL